MGAFSFSHSVCAFILALGAALPVSTDNRRARVYVMHVGLGTHTCVYNYYFSKK